MHKYATSKANKEYCENLRKEGRRRPDTTNGFRQGQTYLQGRRNIMKLTQSVYSNPDLGEMPVCKTLETERNLKT